MSGHERLTAGHGAWNLLIKPHDHPKNKINGFQERAPFGKGNERHGAGLEKGLPDGMETVGAEEFEVPA